MPAEPDNDAIKELTRLIKGFFKVRQQINEAVEETLIKPIVKPYQDAAREFILREHIYNFRTPALPTLGELEEEIRRMLGVGEDVDLQEYLKKILKNPSSDSGERNE